MKFSRLLATGKSLIGMRETNSPYRMRKDALLPKFESDKNPFAVPKPQPPVSTATIPAVGNGELFPKEILTASAPQQRSLFVEVQPEPVTVVAARETILSVPVMAPAVMEVAPTPAPVARIAEPVAQPVIERARLVEVRAISEIAHMPVIVATPKPVVAEISIARSGSGETPKGEQPRDVGGAVIPPAQPKPGAIVGLVDGSPLGLKTGVPSKGGQLTPAPVFHPEHKSNFVAAFVKKLNPLTHLKKNETAGTRVWPRLGRTAVQTELSLDKVKVMRNDLSDADLEFVQVRTAAKSAPTPAPTPARLEPVAAEAGTFGRLTSRLFSQSEAQQAR